MSFGAKEASLSGFQSKGLTIPLAGNHRGVGIYDNE